MTLGLAMNSHMSNKRKEKDKLDNIQIKSICTSKNTINKIKRQPPKQEKIFVSHMCNIRFVQEYEKSPTTQ